MIDNKYIIAVITARAGSKGLPGKNYKLLSGKPLTEWSVLAAAQSKYVDNCYISTNCDHVKESCNHLFEDGTAQLIERPKALATSTSINEEALLHALVWHECNVSPNVDIVINLQPTSPVRNDNLLDRCIEYFIENDADSLLTVSRYTPFFWKKTKEGLKALYDVDNRPMRQKIPENDFLFHDNGCVYMMSRNTLVNRICRIGYRPVIFETTPFQSLQIDTEFDFKLIEKMAEIYGDMV